MINLLRDDLKFQLTGRIWIETADEERFIGVGRLELLTQIQNLGSITKAAKEMGMSYKRAWDLVTSLNALAGRPLVLTQAGGKRGGGAEVTAEGKQLIQRFFTLQARFQEFLRAETTRLDL